MKAKIIVLICVVVLAPSCLSPKPDSRNLSDNEASKERDVSASSASEKEGVVELNNEDLLGTWKHMSISKTADGDGEPLKSASISWTFNEDGTGRYRQEVKISKAAGGTSNFKWELKDRDLVLTPSARGSSTTYTVIKFSKGEMVWRNNRLGDFYILKKQ